LIRIKDFFKNKQTKKNIKLVVTTFFDQYSAIILLMHNYLRYNYGYCIVNGVSIYVDKIQVTCIAYTLLGKHLERQE